uniref:CACTA en-spm transposon protein n=1 Tax=Cucumis melo TaxID=3656 RepID=A0A9I9E7I1_CUCME
MTITTGAAKPIFPHTVCFSQTIGVCMRKIFSVRCLKWADVGREYIKVVNGDPQYSGPEEARANPPNVLVRCHEYWHFLYNHYMSRAFQKQSWTNKAARQKQPYNHSSGSKLFLQRQHRLDERKGKSIDRVELFQKTHVRAGTFVSQAVEDAHNQMLELQSQPTQEGSEMRYAIRNGTNAKADIGHDSGTARTTTWSLALRICNVK